MVILYLKAKRKTREQGKKKCKVLGGARDKKPAGQAEILHTV
jgi:hypothetical protein